MEVYLTEYKHFSTYYKALYKEISEGFHKCLCPSCQEKAINSHVFQKSTILLPLTKERRLYEFRCNLYDKIDVSYRLDGYKKIFAFPGFCQSHDNRLFASIEPNDCSVDWSLTESKYKLAYRTLCRELYEVKCTIYMLCQFLNDVKGAELELYVNWQNNIDKLRCLLPMLNIYKKILEDGIFRNDFSHLQFDLITLPFRFELCIAATISGTDKRGPNFNYDVQELNIVMLFPYGDKTFVILGRNPLCDNIWLNELMAVFNDSENSQDVREKAYYYNRAITDVLFRTDVHCMSPNLYNSLDKADIDAFLEIWLELSDEYDFEIGNRSSIFYKALKNAINGVRMSDA